MPRAKSTLEAPQPVQMPVAPVRLTTGTDYSFQSLVNFVNANFIILLLLGLFFIGGFALGSLWTENQLLKNGSRPTAAAPAAPGAPAAPADQGPTPEQLAAVPTADTAEHWRGNQKAKIVLVEYSDYECPFCARFHPTMQQAMAEFGDDIAWVFRHYPLPFHPNAQKAAEGSECADELGGNDAFWKYSDAIFEVNAKNGALTAQDITDSAVAAGLNQAAFTECLDSGRMASVVKDQMDAGAAAGVSGTPGTFIVVDGKAEALIPGALPFEQVKQSIEQYL